MKKSSPTTMTRTNRVTRNSVALVDEDDEGYQTDYEVLEEVDGDAAFFDNGNTTGGAFFAASGSMLSLTTSHAFRLQNGVSMRGNELATAALSHTANAKDADGDATAVRQPPSKCKVPLHSKDGTVVDYTYVD